MSLAHQVACLVEVLREHDIEQMPPANRRRFADRCRQLAELADALERQPGPRTRPGPRCCGVLAQLRDGERCP